MQRLCIVLTLLTCSMSSQLFAGGLDVGNGGRGLYCETRSKPEQARRLADAGRVLDDALASKNAELISYAYERVIEVQREYFQNAQFFDLWYAQNQLKLDIKSISCESSFYTHLSKVEWEINWDDCELGHFKKLVDFFAKLWPEHGKVFLREYRHMIKELLFNYESNNFIEIMTEQHSVSSPFTLSTEEYSQFSVSEFQCDKSSFPKFSATGILYSGFWLVDWQIYMAFTPTHRSAFFFHEWVVRVLQRQNKTVNIVDVINMTAFVFSNQMDPQFLKENFSQLW